MSNPGNTELGDVQAEVGKFSAGIGFWFTLILAVILGIVGISMIIYGLMERNDSCNAVNGLPDQCTAKNPKDSCVNGKCVISKSRNTHVALTGAVLIIVMGIALLFSWVWRRFVNTNRTTEQIGGAAFEIGELQSLLGR